MKKLVNSASKIYGYEYKGFEIQETDSEYLIRDAAGEIVMKTETDDEATDWIDENQVDACSKIQASSETADILTQEESEELDKLVNAVMDKLKEFRANHEDTYESKDFFRRAGRILGELKEMYW